MLKVGVMAIVVAGLLLPSLAEEGEPLIIDQAFVDAFAECVDITEKMQHSITIEPVPGLMERYEKLLSSGNIDYCFAMTSGIHAMAMEHYITEGDGDGAEQAYLRAVFREDELVIVEASRALGAAYLIGDRGLPRDPEKAIRLLEKARELGSEAADYLLGISYYLGLHGIEQDHKKGFSLLTGLAEKGDEIALALVAKAYIYGQGTTINYKKGLEYAEKSAYAGDPGSQLLTGLGYSTGRGAPVDKIKGYAWIAVSLANGNELARDILNEAGSRLTNQEINKAQQMAAELAEESVSK